MTTITRVPACRTKHCPEPTNPDFHACFCGAKAIHHHHVIQKGMGGRKEDGPVVCLCPTHHEAVHTKRYTDAIEGGYYVIRNRKGQVVIKEAA